VSIDRHRRRLQVRRQLQDLGLIDPKAEGDPPAWWEICERLLEASRWRSPDEHPTQSATPALLAVDVPGGIDGRPASRLVLAVRHEGAWFDIATGQGVADGLRAWMPIPEPPGR
jgi:hypothetical protein